MERWCLWMLVSLQFRYRMIKKFLKKGGVEKRALIIYLSNLTLFVCLGCESTYNHIDFPTTSLKECYLTIRYISNRVPANDVMDIQDGCFWSFCIFEMGVLSDVFLEQIVVKIVYPEAALLLTLK